MTLLLAAYLVIWSAYRWSERWRFLAGFVFVFLLLGASSLMIWPHWILEWIHVMAGYRQYSTPPLVTYLLGDAIGSRLGPALIVGLLVGAIILGVRMRDATPTSAEFSLAISLLLAITVITLLPGQAVYDHVLLLPGIFLIAFSWPSFAATGWIFRGLLSVFALALFWPWISAPAVIALRPLISPEKFASVVLLPIRTAASIPFVELAILGLLMWRKPQRKSPGPASIVDCGIRQVKLGA
jgi:hypothetical protein